MSGSPLSSPFPAGHCWGSAVDDDSDAVDAGLAGGQHDLRDGCDEGVSRQQLQLAGHIDDQHSGLQARTQEVCVGRQCRAQLRIAFVVVRSLEQRGEQRLRGLVDVACHGLQLAALPLLVGCDEVDARCTGCGAALLAVAQLELGALIGPDGARRVVRPDRATRCDECQEPEPDRECEPGRASSRPMRLSTRCDHGQTSSAGSSSTNRAPASPSTRSSTHTRPPCIRTCSSTSARPRPAPSLVARRPAAPPRAKRSNTS